MVESSAKYLQDKPAVVRKRVGAQVLLLQSDFSEDAENHVFDPSGWRLSEPVGSGRGANWYVGTGEQSFVLRHFRRGGAIARLLGDKYWFRSEDSTRSFAEFNLLLKMHRSGLPVPEPVAAGYIKFGPWYRAQLLTRRIPCAQSWSVELSTDSGSRFWEDVGRAVAKVHNALVDHADLNAHNVMTDDTGQVFIIDFDKSTERDSLAGGWRQSNLSRLHRSLNKILPDQQSLVDAGWRQLISAYKSELQSAS
ncbi:MAG: 3-deoxy-D-manno-octulosonic acid kinase [Gammaproteobacteria bacterium]